MDNKRVKWLPVIGYEGLYEVSDEGQVRHVRNGHVIKSITRSSGYVFVPMYKNNFKKVNALHRIVAMAFVENPEGKDAIAHIDGKKGNNSADNLMWVSIEDNPMASIEQSGGTTKKKSVIDLSTKETYESLALACKETGVNYNTAIVHIHRDVPNKRFQYV